jgi:hypothetical protein
MYSTGMSSWLVVVACLVAWWSEATAQERPCSKLQAVAGAAGYQLRPGDPRCEGFYQSPVSGGSLELLSLTANSVDYRLLDNGTLRISAPNVGALNSAEVQVQARALPLGTYYRMDAIIPSAGSMSWPMAPVLAPAQLTADTIGVIGWIERDAGMVLVPVLVSEQPPPAGSGKLIIAILRSSIDLDELRWRSWLDGDSDKPREWKKLADNANALRAGQPIQLKLDTGKGFRLIEVAAKANNSDRWLSLRRRMFEP